MVVAIDFDGVVHDFSHPSPGHRMGPPMPGAKQALDIIHSQGHKIIIFTSRGDPKIAKHVIDWLIWAKIPFDGVTNIKSKDFDLIIDDKATAFTDWEHTMRVLFGG